MLSLSPLSLLRHDEMDGRDVCGAVRSLWGLSMGYTVVEVRGHWEKKFTGPFRLQNSCFLLLLLLSPVLFYGVGWGVFSCR